MVFLIDDIIGLGLGAFTAAIGWFLALPEWGKYLFFIAGLSVTTWIKGATGFGLLESIVSTIFSSAFGIKGFIVTDFQLLVLAVILPFCWFLFGLLGKKQ